MKEYKGPEYHFVCSPGGLSGNELAKLSDDELTRYLNQDSYLQEKKKYRIRSGYILREIAGEYAIIPVNVDSVFSNALMAPNETAAFLWNAFQKPSTIQDVVMRGLLKYDVAEEIIRNSVENFVKQALEYKIIEEVE